MDKIIDLLFSKTKKFIKFFLMHIIEIFREVYKARKGIQFKDLLADFLVVSNSIGGFLILNLIVLLVFIFLPQGNDILLIVAENIGNKFGVINLLWMLIGLFCWSIVSEFACRYAIYVTDNSGKSITDERVHWRKTLQVAYSSIFLILPYIVIILYYLVHFITFKLIGKNVELISYGIPIACIYILLKLVTEYYWRKPKTWISLSEEEDKWCNKLYGIYNDYVFSIRKAENFVGEEKLYQEKLCDSFLKKTQYERDDFPKNRNILSESSLVNDKFHLITFDDTDDKNGVYRWVYRVPNLFFKSLHKQIRIITIPILILYAIFCFLPINLYTFIGAPGLLLFSFAGLGCFYILILFLDYAIFRSYKIKNQDNYKGILFKILPVINLRFLLIIFILCSSYLDNDHPVRNSNGGSSMNDRPSMKYHFKNWMNQYQLNNLYILDSLNRKICPIFFVCAEGGASRTGAYTSMMLSKIQQQCKQEKGIDFKKYVYAYSGVSGGSLGLSFFNSRAYYSGNNDSMMNNTTDFFNKDFLSPLVGKMFYGDLLNLFIPYKFQRFDRAIALEESWECAYSEEFNGEENIFSSIYLNRFKSNHTYPALFINTTEVETGNQCWLCNVVPEESIYKSKDRDLFSQKLNKNTIQFSTMINFSSRFPLFSPGVCIQENSFQKRHYVDGGYVENTGTGTMKEILVSMQSIFEEYKKDSIIIEPFVIVLRFGEETEAVQNINFANELTEIILGIYNTRVGRTNRAVSELKTYTNSLNNNHFIFLSLDKNSKEVPMNWVFSKKSIDNLTLDVNEKWKNKNNNDLKYLPWK